MSQRSASTASAMQNAIPRSSSSNSIGTQSSRQGRGRVAKPQQPPPREPSPELPRLHALVRQQDIKGIQAHLDRVGYRDINSIDHKGRSALHLACLSPSVEIVRLLLRRGAYVHALTDKNQLCPLHCACIKGNLDAARILLKYGADPTLENADGIIPTQLLPKGNRDAQKFAKALFAPKTDSYKASKKDKELLARVAVNDEKSILDLIDKGADVNVVEEKTMMTPLMCAAKQGNEDLTRILLFHCADVHRQDVAKNTALHWACAKGAKSICELLIEFDASVNISDRENGNTPLHWTVIKNHVDLVPLLVIKNKANPNLPDKEGLTPLHLACRKFGMTQMVEALLQLPDIEVDVPDAYGVRPLHIAVRKNDVKIVEALIRLGKADPNVPSLTQNTPLHDACEEPNPDIVRILLETGNYNVNVNALNNDGNTPMHVAVSNLDKKRTKRAVLAILTVLKLLASRGADPNIKNNNNRTPLMGLDPASALVEGSAENIIARTLVTLNADVTLLHRIVFNRDMPQEQKDQIKDLVEYLQRRKLQDQREQAILQRLPAGWRQVTENGETFFVDENNVRSVPPASFMLANDPRMASQTVVTTAAIGRAAAAAAASTQTHQTTIYDDDDDVVSEAPSGGLSLADVSCPLCLELLYKPCTTECGHNFCQPCMEEAIKFHSHCPVCRSPVKGAAGYTVNSMFATIIERTFPERYAQRTKDYQQMIQQPSRR